MSVCISFKTIEYASIPPLKISQFGWAFGLCDAPMQKIKLNQTQSLSQMTICFIEVFGEDLGSRYIGSSIKNQFEYNDYMMAGGQANYDFVFNEKIPIMPD